MDNIVRFAKVRKGNCIGHDNAGKINRAIRDDMLKLFAKSEAMMKALTN